MALNGTSGPAAEDRARLQLHIAVALAAGAAYVIARLMWPFLTAIVTSAVVATLLWPLHMRVKRALRWPSLAALASTLGVFVLVMLPLAGLTAALLSELQSQVPQATESASELLSAEGPITAWLVEFGSRFGLRPAEISTAVAAQVQAGSGYVLSRTVSILSGLGGWLLQAGAALFTLYYLLRDGDRLMARVRWIVPLEPAQTDRLLRLAGDAIHATVLGNVVVAIVQGLLGGLAFWIVGLPGPLFWGLVMGVLSLLPVVGPVFVWVPGAIILFAGGQLWNGLVLTAIGALLISAIDNVLRSILISERAELHPLGVFFSILGGIILFGAVGVLLGPVLFVLAFTVLEMGRLAMLPDDARGEAAADLLPTAAPSTPAPAAPAPPEAR